ncbi:hypothetical protein HMPREF3185_00279 [Porphyromonas somerae]|uniref:Uncharacterized protein n=1 Tax=Porphyromonas somerae TaxID=322095 RepID=A0A134BDD8_9PORP|nr:hypothetical protein HMPREF3184_00279 [Porphyromonadaceae bacterium KA00676]KXB77938.1 hypothetical protein HMPREF3185_00279 [Porphyromonas somerae]
MNSVYISVFEEQRYKHSDEYSNTKGLLRRKWDKGSALPLSHCFG